MAYYLISGAACLADVHPNTLKNYEARGIVTPERLSDGTRMFTDEHIAKVRAYVASRPRGRRRK